jgi:hypothetical protein
MSEHLTKDSLSKELNTKFRLSVEPEKMIDLELVEVNESGDVPGQAERFSAFFCGPLEPFLPQSIYTMEHEQLGSFDLFIVPIRKDEQGFYYEAVFNRVK